MGRSQQLGVIIVVVVMVLGGCTREQWEAENSASDDRYNEQMLAEFEADSLQWEAGWDRPAAWAAIPGSGTTVGQDMLELEKMREKVARVNRLFDKTMRNVVRKSQD